MKYFSTDGVRGIAGVTVTGVLVAKIGWAVAKCGKSSILVAGDSRVSTRYLVSMLLGGIKAGGARACNMGIATTPAVSYLTRELAFDYGIIVTASHNPPYYNGVKILDNEGKKLSESMLVSIEQMIEQAPDSFEPLDIPRDVKLIEPYIAFLKSYSFDNVEVAIDCAYGAGGEIALKAFGELHAKKRIFNYSTTYGIKINEGVGALYPQFIIAKSHIFPISMGICIDGDGDRLTLTDGEQRVYDGDDVIYMLSKKLKKEGRLINNGVIATVMSNGALKECLKREGIELYYSMVGDSKVMELMREKSFVLGGEQSGHIIIADRVLSGDGLLAALEVAELVKNTPLSALALPYRLPQKLINLECENKDEFSQSLPFLSVVDRITKLFKDKGRIIARASGTENKVRIMLEATNEQLLEQAILMLAVLK